MMTNTWRCPSARARVRATGAGGGDGGLIGDEEVSLAGGDAGCQDRPSFRANHPAGWMGGRFDGEAHGQVARHRDDLGRRVGLRAEDHQGHRAPGGACRQLERRERRRAGRRGERVLELGQQILVQIHAPRLRLDGQRADLRGVPGVHLSEEQPRPGEPAVLDGGVVRGRAHGASEDLQGRVRAVVEVVQTQQDAVDQIDVGRVSASRLPRLHDPRERELVPRRGHHIREGPVPPVPVRAGRIGRGFEHRPGLLGHALGGQLSRDHDPKLQRLLRGEPPDRRHEVREDVGPAPEHLERRPPRLEVDDVEGEARRGGGVQDVKGDRRLRDEQVVGQSVEYA